MFFVQKMSGQVQRKPHMLKGLMNSKNSRLLFDYQDQCKVLRKFWRKAFEQELSHLVSFILCLFIIITTIIFLPPMMQGMVAMIVILLFVKMTSSFFPISSSG